MHKQQATLKEIADILNVSISTVSRALRGHPRIGVETKNKVVALAKELGYISPSMAAFEVEKRSRFIGVIVPEISYHLYARAISGIERVAETRDMHIVVCQSNESQAREQSIVRELMELGVAGVIASLASETKDFSHFEDLKQRKIPLVFFNRQCDDVDTDKVVIDNFKAAFDATEHLISIGCKKIAYLGGPKILQISTSRKDGYKAALHKNGLRMDENLIIASRFDRESTLSSARKLLYMPDYPDGILTFSDQMAISVMLAAKERGISIPEEVSLIGFNNEPVGDVLEPSLTSIDQPAHEMGATSAQLILKQIDDYESDYEKKVLKSFLVIRNSTNKNKV